jgi:hypothetical protein
MVAYTGGPMNVGMWSKPVVVDLAGLQIPSQNRPVRFSHDPNQGVGHTESIIVDNGRLIATGVISRDTPIAREIVASAQRGFPWQASISATVLEYETLKAGQKMVVNNRTVEGPAYVITKSFLGEISFVDLGADDATSARVAASADMDKGGDDMTDDKPQDAVDKEEPMTKLHEIRAELERIEAIRKACGGKHFDIEEKAIAEGWDVRRTMVEVVKAERAARPDPSVGNRVFNTSKQLTTDILAAAVALTGRLEKPERYFDEKVLDAAHKYYRQGIGLRQLILESAWANGYPGRSIQVTREVLQYAFRHTLEAGWSAVDLETILKDSGNRYLLAGFDSVESVWRAIADITQVTDFKIVTRLRMVVGGHYEKVGPGGEIKHGTLSEEGFPIKADTYALMLTITRQDIINDDLGAITDVPRQLGYTAGRTVNDEFWKVFVNNASFFTAARKNLLTGASSALSFDALKKAMALFGTQTAPDGKPLGILPKTLLVPVQLYAEASQLVNSAELRDTTANTKYPTSNPFKGLLEVQQTAYLSNPNIPGASEKAWYLTADPRSLAVIEITFLNGQQAPVVETADADFNTLGIQMRGYHDFGVALRDWRAAVKAAGE